MVTNWNGELYISLAVIFFSIIGSFFILRLDWKKYGLLYVLSAFVGNVLCYIFVTIGFYTFPNRFFPNITSMPILTVSTAFPFLVLFGVHYSPELWKWKIPFYWTLVHIGVFAETFVLSRTDLIQYTFKWDLFDSYSWWWIYLLLFEWVGNLIIPNNIRRPIPVETFYFGRLGWGFVHFVLIVTIFLAGYYLGVLNSEPYDFP
ncbi:hypothetical protein SAMN05216389_101245 [Oceanobacillus limi]|uniref:Uncharacterized protein n=1 Tax=Oceanobacillus limi TaxID=930131 RepID=A0A1H9Y7Z0_9BACI|nr:CBO0543 family protein [Oceanobacillus limi]SES64910.1 hypothetical protein SAMN05216389_101245 [Oceanobacillus limi]